MIINNTAKLGYPIRMTFCFADDMTCSIVSSHVIIIIKVISKHHRCDDRGLILFFILRASDRFSFLVWYGLKWPTVNRKKNSIYYLQINRIIYKNLIWSNNYNSILRIALFFYCSQDDINSNIRNNNTYTCVPCTWHCGRDTLGLDTISHSMTNLLMVMSLLYSIKLLWIDVWLNNGYSLINKAKLGYPIRMTFCFDDDMTCSIVSSHVTSIRNVI